MSEKSYTIKELSQITGYSPNTIRMYKTARINTIYLLTRYDMI